MCSVLCFYLPIIIMISVKWAMNNIDISIFYLKIASSIWIWKKIHCKISNLHLQLQKENLPIWNLINRNLIRLVFPTYFMNFSIWITSIFLIIDFPLREIFPIEEDDEKNHRMHTHTHRTIGQSIDLKLPHYKIHLDWELSYELSTYWCMSARAPTNPYQHSEKTK